MNVFENLKTNVFYILKRQTNGQ